tara:strand:+ start:581 stop:715 length:135 start_codon:yes stop_codon:yes gene_type:complete
MEEIFETFLKDLGQLHDQGIQALKEYKLKNTLLNEEINHPITNS